MTIILNFLVILLSVITLSAAVPSYRSARIINGIQLDTIRRFPHHVTIFAERPEGSGHCSGSIIADKYILTSMRCLQFGTQYRIDVNRIDLSENYSQNEALFSITIGPSAAILYPTEYAEQDDIALLQLPIKLDFIHNLKPIELDVIELPPNKLAVMPGFSEDKTELVYGMFRRSDNCTGHDDKLQYCARGWNNGNQVPCKGNEGGGLVVDWPQFPRLNGIYSYSTECTKGSPSYYTNVNKYISWIKFVINGNDDPNDDPTTEDVPA